MSKKKIKSKITNKIYFYISDWEVAQKLDLWDREIYETDLPNFISLVNEILFEPNKWWDTVCGNEFIPFIFSLDKNYILKEAREICVSDEPTNYQFKGVKNESSKKNS